MSLRIESYKEEYLEGMVELGYKILNQQWKHANQTTAKNLEKAYSSSPNFDPSTKLYLFEDDKLVAFLPSTIKPADENGVITVSFHQIIKSQKDPNFSMNLVLFQTGIYVPDQGWYWDDPDIKLNK